MTGSLGPTMRAAEIIDPRADRRLAGLSEPSFRLLIENTADGVLVVDLAGTVLYANPAAAEIFGHPRDELLHVPLGRPVASGETTEITVHRPGRGPAEVQMRVVEVTWDGARALLASLRDVSAERAQEERRHQSQKLEAVGRLTAGIIHDFNNLLTVIQAGLRLLERQIARDPASPQIREIIEELSRRIQNGGALTHQLLAFSRRQSLTPEPVDLNQRLDAVTTILERSLGSSIVIHRNLDPALGPILIDVNQLDVAILNLAVNARDAMGGRGTLTIETSDAPEAIEDAPGIAATHVRVTVADTGCGMSREVLAQVFEPFFTTKGEGEGTGLGLSQVHGFIAQSGGHIRIDSEVGRGTRVHLFLPRVPASGALGEPDDGHR